MLKSLTSAMICAAAIAAMALPAQAASQRVSGRVGQFARWRDQICVHVDGLTFDQAAKIAARVGDVAKAVGVSVLPAGCPSANIEVEFTSQPQSLLDNITQKRQQLLGFHYSAETKALKTVTRSIQAWYMTATVGLGPNAGATFGGVTNQSGKSEVIDDPNNTPPTGCAESRIATCLSSVYSNVLVVVDTDHLPITNLGHPQRLYRPGGPVPARIARRLRDRSEHPRCDGQDALPRPRAAQGPDPGRRRLHDRLLYASDLRTLKATEQADIDARMQAILANAKPQIVRAVSNQERTAGIVPGSAFFAPICR